jgi:hypothetical protein
MGETHQSPANRKQGDPLGLLPTMSPCFSGIFCLFPLSMPVLLNTVNKNSRHIRKINYLQRLLSYFCWFQPYHFANSHWCDSPFNKSDALQGNRQKVQYICRDTVGNRPKSLVS